LFSGLDGVKSGEGSAAMGSKPASDDLAAFAAAVEATDSTTPGAAMTLDVFRPDLGS
jgi:hypothetical protein